MSLNRRVFWQQVDDADIHSHISLSYSLLRPLQGCKGGCLHDVDFDADSVQSKLWGHTMEINFW